MQRDAGIPQMRLEDLPFSPAAERNAEPILALLQAWLPTRARVLEIASGTGQHALHMAAAQPGWEWQPSEAMAESLSCLAARCAGQPNVCTPLQLNVMAQPWPVDAASFDAMFVANLLHIAPWDVTPAVLQGAVRCLKPGGLLVIYGPFMVDGTPLAPSNAAFDADLRMRDERWGLRELEQVEAAAHDAGMVLTESRTMPANNLMLRFQARSTARSTAR